MAKAKKKARKKGVVRMPNKDGVTGPKKLAIGEKKEPLRLWVSPNSLQEKGGVKSVKEHLMETYESLPKII